MERVIDPAACYCSALRRAARQVSRHYDRALAPTGLTVGQFAILAEIEGGAPPTIGRLASALSMDPAGLRHTLRPLLRDGLVTLGQDPKDRRVAFVSITASGSERLRLATPAWAAAQDAFEAAAGVPEAGALRSLLAVTSRIGADEPQPRQPARR